MPKKNPQDEEIEIGIRYPAFQLAQALKAADTRDDESARAQAVKKIEKWVAVVNGMLTGALSVGSRTPVRDAPAWATPEVAHGGFATGKLSAEGPISLNEELLIYRICPGALPGTERGRVNSYFLSDAGIAELQRMLSTGCYRIGLPEEGALLVVAWLLKHGYTEQARSIVESIGPFLGRLRFYPIPADNPSRQRDGLYRQTVNATIEDLNKISKAPQVEAQREALGVWLPLYDKLVDIILETVEDGWPCQVYPAGWQARATALLSDYDRLLEKHPLCVNRHDPSRGGMGFLREVLRKSAKDNKELTGLEVTRARTILQSIEKKRGLPGSDRANRLRSLQAPLANRLTTREQAQIIIRRLAHVDQDEALTDVDAILQPLTTNEITELHVPIVDTDSAQTIRPTLAEKLLRSKRGTLDQLMALGVIPSAEVLATLIPQMTGGIRSADIKEVELGDLYVAVYTAFRKRRSLLLLYYANQVQFRELPWAASMERQRRLGDSKSKALECLRDVVSATLVAFPHQILPNKLLPEIRELANAAGLSIPITDELAADIFMGKFTQKFLRAAHTAAKLLDNSIYHRYYNAPFAQVVAMPLPLPLVKKSKSESASKSVIAENFSELCREVANLDSVSSGSRAAHNGRVIEQQLILTTHNLAVLFDAMDLRESLREQLPTMAQKCFRWICRCHQLKLEKRRPYLHMVKNTAYAWRQMLFYLSVMPETEVDRFIGWASEFLAQQRMGFRGRFEPVFADLVKAHAGETITQPECRFLGWSNGQLWLPAVRD